MNLEWAQELLVDLGMTSDKLSAEMQEAGDRIEADQSGQFIRATSPGLRDCGWGGSCLCRCVRVVLRARGGALLQLRQAWLLRSESALSGHGFRPTGCPGHQTAMYRCVQFC